MKIELEPWITPNFAIMKTRPGNRQDGIQERPKFHLRDIDAYTLDDLCNQFRADVFSKAEKTDPRIEASKPEGGES